MPVASIPPTPLPLLARAPGKAILFGEHAVVYGKTAVVLALDLQTQLEVRVSAGGAPTYNGSAEAAAQNPYFRSALELIPPPNPLALRAISDLPKASGLGSSAAFTSALVASLLALQGGATRERLAELSFRAERGAQGVGSPVDTSAAIAGGLLAVGSDPPGARLWSLPRLGEGPAWSVARLADPGWSWVVGFSGVPRETGEVVRRVRERLARPDGPELLDRIARVSGEGVSALERKDRPRVGALLEENQVLLVELGISHPRLDALLTATRGLALGAKITGAGGGGSIIALSPEGGEQALARALTRAGGVPFVVRAAPAGASVGPAGADGAPGAPAHR